MESDPEKPMTPFADKKWMRLKAIETARLLIALALLPGSCGVSLRSQEAPQDSTSSTLQPYQFEQAQMGVGFQIILHHSDPDFAQSAAAKAFERVEALNQTLSDYEYDSELSALSRTSGSGRFTPVSPDLWNVLWTAGRIAQRSDHALDVTVGPLTSLWRHARRKGALPEDRYLQPALSRVGWEHLILNASTRSALLRLPDMRLDLGGIAKGYALEEASRVLEREKIEHYLIRAGGDMTFGAAPPNQEGWRVGAGLAPNSKEPLKILRLQRTAIATSGDLYQYLEIDGVRYSHIVNPKTGVGLTNQSLVTVIAPTGTVADGLATAISVLPPEQGAQLAKDWPEPVQVLIQWHENGEMKSLSHGMNFEGLSD